MRSFHQIDKKAGLFGLPDEACKLHEEMYYYRNASPNGHGWVQKTVGMV